MASKKTYHHGNLRVALVAAATRLLARQGPAACTLRAVAAAAGVSQAAPYHHFAGKDDLLDAVVAGGFDRLAAVQEKAMRKASGAYERLRANGTAYVAFAIAHPALFRLMFGRDYSRPGFQSRYRDVADRSYHLFSEACRDALAGRSQFDPTLFRLSSWSLVHGLASLLIDQRIGELVRPALGKVHDAAIRRSDVDRIAIAVIDTLIAAALRVPPAAAIAPDRTGDGP